MGFCRGPLIVSARSVFDEDDATSNEGLSNCVVPFVSDYKISSTNSTIDSFKTARLAGDPTPFTAALVIDMGVFGPDGLSTRNTSYSGKKITYPLQPTEHTTIQRLVADASSYEFVLHPGDLAYAGELITSHRGTPSPRY